MHEEDVELKPVRFLAQFLAQGLALCEVKSLDCTGRPGAGFNVVIRRAARAEHDAG